MSRFIIIILAVLAIAFLLNASFDEIEISKEDWGYIVYMAIFAAFIGSSGLYYYKGRTSKAVKDIFIWIGILMLIIFAYSFRHDFQDVKNRITAQLFPHKASINEYGEVTFQASGDNHFYIEALVNGTIIRFLVDTGASRVVLTPKDAVRLGFQLDKLDFNQKSSTANGIVFGAPIVIDEIEVGDFSKRRIPASINGAEMRHSLLGMSFLGKLKSYRVEKGVLTLEP